MTLPQLPVGPAASTWRATQPLPGAGFWRRLAAYLIDGLVLGAVTAFIAILLNLATGGMVGASVQLLSFVLAFVYFAGLESSSWQATLGKRALGMQVVDDQEQALSFLHALGRYVAAALNWLTLGIGYALVGIRDDKRGLHDLLAKTRVVIEDPNDTGTPTLAWVVIGLYAALMAIGVVLAIALAVAMS